jgi:signal transduction histidine kinase
VTDAPAAKAKIVVVDDTEPGLYVKVQTLRRAGFTVLEASNGSDALSIVARERPDLVVLDVNLPDISGLEVTRRLRSSPEIPGIQILQISNTAIETADRVRGLEQGADVYLTEPVEGEVLVATVHSLLRVRRAETALARALDGERKARQLAEEANRLKDEFIATLSHELRTPLNALMGWIWQLRHTTLAPAAQSRALDSLERNTRIQAQLNNDLLDISRAARGKLQLEMRVFNLEDVIAAASESVRDAAAAQHLKLSVTTTPVWVAADQARMQQVVTNLLTNAVQFTPEDGAITVTLRADDRDAILTVEDTGAGIDPAFLPHVFDQFRQGEGVLSRKHGGLGLGLAVVRQMVDLHGGSVAVTSEGAGRGATFTVRLPRETAPPAPVDEPRLLLEGVRVLLVSREAEHNTIAPILQSSGAEVRAVTATPEAPETVGVDVVVNEVTNSPWRLRRAADAAAWHNIDRAAPAAEIVRRVARLISE